MTLAIHFSFKFSSNDQILTSVIRNLGRRETQENLFDSHLQYESSSFSVDGCTYCTVGGDLTFVRIPDRVLLVKSLQIGGHLANIPRWSFSVIQDQASICLNGERSIYQKRSDRMSVCQKKWCKYCEAFGSNKTHTQKTILLLHMCIPSSLTEHNMSIAIKILK